MSKGTILLADDSPTILEMVKYILKMGDYEVTTASDGLEAAEKAYETSPDLVILDIMMPRMNGYQTCRLLKNDPATRHIPVIILTSKDQASDKYWGLAIGADAYMTKDFRPQQILETVETIMAGRKAPTVAPPVSEKPRSTMDIISKVNDLLDKKLYEATIINEIGNVAHKLSDFEETVGSVMTLLSRLIDYTTAAVALSYGQRTEVLIQLHHTVGTGFTESFKERVLTEMASYGIDPATREVSVTILDDKEPLDVVAEKGNEVGSILTTPIRVNDEVKGLVAVGSPAASGFNDEDQDVLEIISHQAYVVIENARLYREISRISVTDGLTGIYNRRYLMEWLEKEFSRARRHDGEMAFIIMDIDHFKKVNDTYGHQIGDLVLKEAAQIVQKALRASDIVGRYGGEEFCVILPETSLAGAVSVAEHLRTAIETHLFESGDVSLTATASFGVSSYPSEGISTSAEIIKAADEALYRAKEGGRNRVCSG